MQFPRTFSTRFILGLIVTAPTVFLSTFGSAIAQPVFQPTLSKPQGNLEIKKPSSNLTHPGVAKLLQQAKNDPVFFRALTSNPEQALANINYLDPATKAALAKLIPEEIATGGLSEAASGCVCTGCCVTKIGKPGQAERLDPIRNLPSGGFNRINIPAKGINNR
ncbi:hypothetical protein WA1_22255 [Scytonema hofmannii PCC 7110]|uniref:Uncharacterized protein n=1 Tax=Scytonema hofmannii PCC 7110 TaxID=128403 RepID=A0A139X9P2_9CYAN|nr:hypothetical protein [Scytonema hofmannii]KYC41418.1 hypothetical protein WA1_22255 [Scytonema hofmannii PCC 7110]